MILDLLLAENFSFSGATKITLSLQLGKKSDIHFFSPSSILRIFVKKQVKEARFSQNFIFTKESLDLK